MGQALLTACFPWFLWLASALAAARLLVYLSRARFRRDALATLHVDQRGAVQSLSFVLTLPIFVMLILFIIQVSQLMIGTVVVHYAAFAAARSAVVWIPARLESSGELENRISSYALDPEAPDQVYPILDPTSPDYGPVDGGLTFLIRPGSPKYEKIASAAILACLPIAPSRDLGFGIPNNWMRAHDVLQRTYALNVPEYSVNSRVSRRLENKLAYAARATEVEIRFFHSNREPPLVPYGVGPDVTEFAYNEIGFQDPITVTVRHYMALLPGPGRLLAKTVESSEGGVDTVAASIQQIDGLYVYPLEASIVLGNEGEKSVLPYRYFLY
ncbi:hypothetical protein JCM19992_15700 [Thermostilla marina]